MTERERALLQGKKINPLTANESALAYAVAHSGGSEPSYETVAEIQVGEMTEDTDIYTYVFNDVAPLTIDTDETYYLNSADNPSTIVQNLNGILVIAFNADSTEELTPTDPNKPVFGVSWGEGKCRVMSDTDSFSNTTVKILKKVEQSGGGASAEKFVVMFTVGQDGETIAPNKEPSAILAAQGKNKTVVGRLQFGSFMIEAPLVEYGASRLAFGVVSSRVSYNIIWNGEYWEPHIYQLAEAE